MPTTAHQQNEISSETLRQYLPDNLQTEVPVAYRSGLYAARFTVSDLLVLIRHQQVFGIEKRGKLRSIRLAVSIHAAYRTLAICRMGSHAKPESISKRSNHGMVWVERFDRAKLGRVGGFSTLTLQGARLA